VGHSIFIGVSASIICNMAQRWKEGSMVDDTLDVFPCHGVGGIVGMILTAVFAKDVGLFYGETTTFVNHLLALGLVSCFVLSGSYALFHLTDRLLSLRVSEEEEDIGLDYCLHGENMDSLSETIERLLDSNKERAS
jgi:Amt family ammonium transporter